MSRRPVLAVALITAAAISTVPAHAAAKRPKPIKGSYTVTLTPDPVQDVTGQVPTTKPAGCDKTLAGSYNDHPFKVPAAGKLTVTLDAPGGTSTPLGPDWDLWIFDSAGEVVDASHGATAHEETSDKFKKGQSLVFEVCNLTGQNTGNVSYTFTYA